MGARQARAEAGFVALARLAGSHRLPHIAPLVARVGLPRRTDEKQPAEALLFRNVGSSFRPFNRLAWIDRGAPPSGPDAVFALKSVFHRGGEGLIDSDSGRG